MKVSYLLDHALSICRFKSPSNHKKGHENESFIGGFNEVTYSRYSANLPELCVWDSYGPVEEYWEYQAKDSRLISLIARLKNTDPKESRSVATFEIVFKILQELKFEGNDRWNNLEFSLSRPRNGEVFGRWHCSFIQKRIIFHRNPKSPVCGLLTSFPDGNVRLLQQALTAILKHTTIIKELRIYTAFDEPYKLYHNSFSCIGDLYVAILRDHKADRHCKIVLSKSKVVSLDGERSILKNVYTLRAPVSFSNEANKLMSLLEISS